MRLRFSALLLLCLVCPLSACSKAPDTMGLGDVCDDAHPCQSGQECLAGHCVPVVPAPDLAMSMDLRPAPDLTMAACAGMSYKWATSSLTLPPSNTSYAVDFDGDGKADNQFGNIVSTIALANLDLQPPVTDAVAGGQLVELLQLDAKGLADSDCAALQVQGAVPRGPGDPRPKYDGSDLFTIPMGQVPAQLSGAIAGGRLETTRPPKLAEDNVPHLDLQLPLLGAGLPLSLYGVHVQGAVQQGGVMSGEVHGVIRQEDIDGAIIPALASLLTLTINADPASATTDTLVKLFEDPVGNMASQMKCKVAADCCQKIENRKTCKILPEEVKSNAIVANILKPDVQVFDGAKWKPVARGTNKNGLSLGLAFTAVKAGF